MPSLIATFNKIIEKIALHVVTLEPGDIPALGKLLKDIKKLEERAHKLNHPIFTDLTYSLRTHLERLVLEDSSDLQILEEGIVQLQSVYHTIRNKGTFEEDITGLLNRLQNKNTEPDMSKPTTSDDSHDEVMETTTKIEQPRIEIADDDREILCDFIVEARENLGGIEVSVIDLEQEPDNLETINAIFRPIHTIKGISGFLNLTKINQLAHSAEELLEKARASELRIDSTIIDLILDIVDILKKLIEQLHDQLEGRSITMVEIDVFPLIHQIEEIHAQSEQMGNKRLGEILVQKGIVQSDDLERALRKQQKEPDKRIGEILMEDESTNSREVVSALRDQKKFGKGADLQVKVDTNKLDNLVDLTGELVITQAMLKQNPLLLSMKDQKLEQSLTQLNQITTGLQRTAMSMRMVHIKHTFQKMVRLVRDLAKNSGKEVVLLMSGEDTEIDRNVVEELYEPMVHMIRNAVDHGLEFPDERERIGKPRKGTIFLKAYHLGGNVIIEIKDDGRGLNKERIIEKAKTSHIITDETGMSDSDIYNLIFQPGFSTAVKVTDVSGRGVGMDVVKKNIETLKGRVEISSYPGRGSTFRISLPLTLAIIEGMIIRVGEEKYIIPTLAILESFRPDKKQYATVEGKGEMILLRGQLIPLIRLNQTLGLRGDSSHPWDGLLIAVENEGEKRCLLSDELLGKEEVVIKSLGGGLMHTKGIAGGAILGDGKVSLILDMAGLFELARNN